MLQLGCSVLGVGRVQSPPPSPPHNGGISNKPTQKNETKQLRLAGWPGGIGGLERTDSAKFKL